MALSTEVTFVTSAQLAHVRSFNLTGFVKDSNLMPCENMLASCVQEIASERLCDFLQNMDAQEYEILKKENRKYTHLQPNWECFSQLKNRTVFIVAGVAWIIFFVVVSIVIGVNGTNDSKNIIATMLGVSSVAIPILMSPIILKLGTPFWRSVSISGNRLMRIDNKIASIKKYMEPLDPNKDIALIRQLESVKTSFFLEHQVWTIAYPLIDPALIEWSERNEEENLLLD